MSFSREFIFFNSPAKIRPRTPPGSLSFDSRLSFFFRATFFFLFPAVLGRSPKKKNFQTPKMPLARARARISRSEYIFPFIEIYVYIFLFLLVKKRIRKKCPFLPKFSEFIRITSEEMPITSERMAITSEEMPITSEGIFAENRPKTAFFDPIFYPYFRPIFN